MKLIIDIPEETYNNIQSRDWKNGKLVFSKEWKAIHNGIPLDGVLQEIRQEIAELGVDLQDGPEDWRSYVNDTVLECLEIIDKRIKEYTDEV